MTEPVRVRASSVSRRSFLAAIAGGIAAQALPKQKSQADLLTRFDELWAELQKACADGPVWQPFWVWEWAELSGNAERLAILPPPLPPQMLIQETSIYFPPAVPVSPLTEIFNTWELRMRLNERDLVSGSIRYFAPRVMPFAAPFDVRRDDNLKIELQGDAFSTSEPVKLQAVFKGMVRIV